MVPMPGHGGLLDDLEADPPGDHQHPARPDAVGPCAGPENGVAHDLVDGVVAADVLADAGQRRPAGSNRPAACRPPVRSKTG